MRVIVESKNSAEAKSLVSAAIKNEIKVLEIGIKKTKRNIEQFEKQHEMDTESFYKRYTAGLMGDDAQYIRWAGEYETLLKLESDLKEIDGAEIC